jgi:transcription antitermination factor NusG
MGVVRTDFHIFRAAPQCEAIVCKVLKRRGVEAIAPHTAAFERVGKSRSRVATSQPVFPGYVFASIHGRQWGGVREVPYLQPQPLAFGGTPYRLTEADVACIRGFDGITDPRAPVAPRRYVSGELVRILQGPFASFKATVDADKGRKVHVSAQIFGRPTPVTVPRHWIERAA